MVTPIENTENNTEVMMTTHTLEPVKRPKAPRGPRKTTSTQNHVRDIEELDRLDPKKMSPEEAANYIEALREVIVNYQIKLNELKKNAESSYDQFRNADKAYQALKADSDRRLNYYTALIKTAYEGVLLAGSTRV